MCLSLALASKQPAQDKDAACSALSASRAAHDRARKAVPRRAPASACQLAEQTVWGETVLSECMAAVKCVQGGVSSQARRGHA